MRIRPLEKGSREEAAFGALLVLFGVLVGVLILLATKKRTHNQKD